MKKFLCLVGLLLATSSHATIYSGFKVVPTDSINKFVEPAVDQPPYLGIINNSTFNTTYQRVGANAGSFHFSLDNSSGTWGDDARHHYSKDQPWSANGNWFKLESNDGTPTGGYKILDAFSNYIPYRSFAWPSRKSGTGKLFTESRWDPRAGHADELTGVLDSVSAAPLHGWVQRINIVDGSVTASIAVDDSLGDLRSSGARFGDGEGNMSNSGRWLALGQVYGGRLRIQIIDIDSARAGPVNVLPITNLADSTVDHYSISPSGKYLVVKYGQNEVHRIFAVDTLANPLWGTVTPMSYTCLNSANGAGQSGTNSGIYNRSARYVAAAPGDTVVGDTTGAFLGSGLAKENGSLGGWIGNYSHPDYITNSDSSNVDFLVGLPRTWSSQSTHQIVATNLATGVTHAIAMESITGSSLKSRGPDFVSCRNISRPSWAYIGYETDAEGDTSRTGKRFNDEIIAININSNPLAPTIQRFGHAHVTFHDSPLVNTAPYWAGENGSSSTYYRNQMHSVPNIDGTRIAFASNWVRNCGGTTPSGSSIVIDASNFAGSGTSSSSCGVITQRTSYVIDASCKTPLPASSLYSSTQGDASIAINWTDPQQTSFNDPPTSVKVYRAVQGGTVLVTSDSLVATVAWTGGSHSVEFTGLGTNVCYDFALVATNDCGVSSEAIYGCFCTTDGSGGQRHCGGTRIPKPKPQCDGCIFYVPPGCLDCVQPFIPD